jgi:hypothetical protein
VGQHILDKFREKLIQNNLGQLKADQQHMLLLTSCTRGMLHLIKENLFALFSLTMPKPLTMSTTPPSCKLLNHLELNQLLLTGLTHFFSHASSESSWVTPFQIG